MIPHEAVYCPNCGVTQEAEAAPEASRPGNLANEVAFRRRTRQTRLTVVFLILGTWLALFFLGSFTHLSSQEAGALVEEFRSIIPSNPTAITIFRHNLYICLNFLIPIYGIAQMAISSYSSGLVLSAIATAVPGAPTALTLDLITLIFPWTWTEVAAYTLASSESIMIIIALIRRTLRTELKTFLKILAVCVALLAIGAMIEVLANTALNAAI